MTEPIRVEAYRDPFMPTLPILDAEIVPVDLDKLRGQTREANLLSYIALEPRPQFYAYAEPKRGLIRRVIDDPYWVLITLASALGLAIVGTIVYGVTQIVLAVEQWWSENGHTVVSTGQTILVVIVLLALCGGGAAAKCAGIHCGGCKG